MTRTTKPSQFCRVVLFDVLGTLVYDPFYEEVPAFFGMSLEELLEVKHPSAWIEFESGRIGQGAFLDRFFTDGRRYDQEGLIRRMQESYRWLDGARELLCELRARGYSLHALSNYPLWYRWIEERLRLSRYLEWSFVSCDTGVRKPAAEAFRGPLRTLGLRGPDCLFVDDRPENCAAARAAGLEAIRFRGARDLRRDLQERGLLSQESPP